MQPRLLDSLAYGSAPLDKAIAWIVKGLLVFMPLALGAVQAWSEWVVVLAAAALVVLLTVRTMLCRDCHLVWTWAFVPLALFLALGLFQVIPLPASWIGTVSPATLSLKMDLLSDLPATPNHSLTLSFYPHASFHGLRLALVATVLFTVVINVFRRTDQIRDLLAWIAEIGTLVALIALVQDFGGSGIIYGFVPANCKTAGPFQNYNHLSQFLNLSIGAALGLVLIKLHEQLGRDCSLPRLARHVSRPEFRPLIWLFAIILLCAAAIFMSSSRMGMISCVVALLFAGIFLNLTGHTTGRGWLLSILALAILAAVLLLGFDAVYARLATLEDLPGRYRDRWQILTDLTAVWRQFPLFGSGLGTHETFYPLFDRSGDLILSTHAENQYAQMAEEVGFVGLLCILGFLGLIAVAWVQTIHHAHRPLSAAAYGLGAGLLAVIIHSWTDFGQQLTAVTGLTAVVCALLVRLARDRDRVSTKTPSALSAPKAARIASGLPQWAILACLVLACTASVWGATRAFFAENAWRTAATAESQLQHDNWQGPDDLYAQLLTAASTAAYWEPAHIVYGYRLNLARWHAISRQVDPVTGFAVLDAQGVATARKICEQLNTLRRLCPTYTPPCSLAGQIERLVFKDLPRGAELIRKAYRLTPHDSTVCFAAGLLETEDGDFTASVERFARIRHTGFATLAQYYVDYFDRPDAAITLADSDPYSLLIVAGQLAKSPDRKPLADQTRAAAIATLRARAAAADATPVDLSTLGRILHQEREFTSAIDCFRRVLDTNYGDVGCRLAMAQCLAATGQRDAAIREARICLRLRPQLLGAVRVITEAITPPKPAAP